MIITLSKPKQRVFFCIIISLFKILGVMYFYIYWDIKLKSYIFLIFREKLWLNSTNIAFHNKDIKPYYLILGY